MTKNDFNAGQESGDQSDPLSATAMFLRSFDSAPAEEAKPDPWKTLSEPATAHTAAPSEQAAYSSPSQSAPAVGSSGAGEFTKMFQAQNQPASSPTSQALPPSFTQAPPVLPPQVKPEFSAGFNPPQPPATGQGPGEFTRIFVAASTAPGEQSAKTIVEPPAFVPPPPPQAASSASPQKLKGFSAPGVSDSASGEGSVTQFFKAATPSPSASPAPVSSAPPPQATPVAETPWRRDDEFFKSTAPAEPASSMPGATGLLSTLSSPGASYGGSRPAEPVPYRPEPMPSYTPPPASSEPATPESGSVTKLIQRLSQVPREAPVEPPPPPLPAAPPVSSGPGEFTRMISGDLVKAAVAGGAPAAAAAPPPPAPAAATGFPPMSAMPHPAMPAVPHPAMPAPVIPHAAPAPPPPAAPHLAAPHLAVPAIPKPAPPAIPAPALAAPKGKLEAMVPILLVINTFLLIVLLVVVVFAMKGK
jgi:hypothetical protein